MILKRNLKKDEIDAYTGRKINEIDFLKEEERFQKSKGNLDNLYLPFPKIGVNSLEYAERFLYNSLCFKDANILPSLINNYLLDPLYKDKYQFFADVLKFNKFNSYLLAKQILSDLRYDAKKVISIDENGLKVLVVKEIMSLKGENFKIDTYWNVTRDLRVDMITASRHKEN